MDDPQQKPFKIKLRPLLDQKTLDGIAEATLEAIKDFLVPPKMAPDDIGKGFGAEGVYLGTYAPVDRNGVSLEKVFNVFAASEDLFVEKKESYPFLRKIFKMATTRRINIFTYADTVKHISSLKNWHGHDGTNYATDEELYAALDAGTYNGGWIVPTLDILKGENVNSKYTTPDNLFAHKDKGLFKSRAALKPDAGCRIKITTRPNKSACPDYYWSSTQATVDPSLLYVVWSENGYVDWDLKDNHRLSCRPVRLVPIK